MPVDAPKIERIIENLVMNAVRHTDPDVGIWVRVWPQDGGAVIAVEDDGPGVPLELRHDIFEAVPTGTDVVRARPRDGHRAVAGRDVRGPARRPGLGPRSRKGGPSFRVFLPG